MKYVLVRHILSAVFSFVSACYFVPIMFRVATKCGILDQPDGNIKTHSGGIPYLGGLAIYMSFISTLALFYPFQNSVLWLLLGTTILLFCGLVDDLIVITPLQKIMGQSVAVLCFLKGGFALKTDFFSTSINLFASGFWLLLMINAFNLVDVMDGLSSTIALGSGITFLMVAIISKNYALSLLLVAFIIPIAVFLSYNKPPAKMYLGDSGSLFIGGFLSAIPFLFSWSEYSPYGFFVPIIILGVPLLEVSSLIIIRTAKGIPFYKGSPDHFSIYLMNKGWSKNKVLVFVSFCILLLAGVSITLFLGWSSIWTILTMMILFIFMWIKAVAF